MLQHGSLAHPKPALTWHGYLNDACLDNPIICVFSYKSTLDIGLTVPDLWPCIAILCSDMPAFTSESCIKQAM